MSYIPSRMPAIKSLEELQMYVEKELDAIAQASAETTALDLRPIYVAPLRPREGLIVFADGTEWNPGGGAGAYQYLGGAWVKL